MLATDNFTMRISPKEKKELFTVTKHFQFRSRAELIKTVVRQLHEQIKAEQSAQRQSGQNSPVSAV